MQTKELLYRLPAIPQLAAAICCIVVLFFLFYETDFPQIKSQVFFETAAAATFLTAFLLGLESVVFMSKGKRGIRNGLIFAFLSTLIFSILLILAASVFHADYTTFSTIKIEEQLYDKKILENYDHSYNIAMAASGCLILSLPLLTYLLYREIADAYKAHRREGSHSDTET